MRKTASALLVLSLLCLSAAPASAAPFVRKSEYPKYLYDAPVFKKGKEQKKAVDWLIANFWLDQSVYFGYPNGSWYRNDEIKDGSFDRVLRAQKEVQDQIWKVYNPKGAFSMDANGDFLYDKNGLVWPYSKGWNWQSAVNSWKLEYAKNPPKGFFKKSSSPEAIETFAYSDFSGYRKADGTRDLNFVKDYLKVRDTMMLYQSPQAFATTGITHEYDILVNQMELARGIFLSLFKQKYYGKGYRDIDEEIKYWFPGTFTDFGDNLTFDGRNVYEKYTPIYLMRYFGGERVDKFPGKGFEKALEDVSATVDGMRAGCTDENAFLKKVIVLREGYEAERKGYDMKYRKTFKDYESFYAMKKMELILGMLNGYISFHSISNLPALREFYAIASLDKDGNAVFSKKTEKVRKLK